MNSNKKVFFHSEEEDISFQPEQSTFSRALGLNRRFVFGEYEWPVLNEGSPASCLLLVSVSQQPEIEGSVSLSLRFGVSHEIVSTILNHLQPILSVRFIVTLEVDCVGEVLGENGNR